jgi:hypothetical protein
MNKEGLKYAGGMGAGLATVLGAGYADLQSSKRALEKEREDKNADKIEEMKRKQEPSGGGGGEATARPKVMKAGGKVSSASSRADGCATKGKTKGRFV